MGARKRQNHRRGERPAPLNEKTIYPQKQTHRRKREEKTIWLHVERRLGSTFGAWPMRVQGWRDFSCRPCGASLVDAARGLLRNTSGASWKRGAGPLLHCRRGDEGGGGQRATRIFFTTPWGAALSSAPSPPGDAGEERGAFGKRAQGVLFPQGGARGGPFRDGAPPRLPAENMANWQNGEESCKH